MLKTSYLLYFCLNFNTRHTGIFTCSLLSACFCSWGINLFWCSGHLLWYSKQYIFFDVRTPRHYLIISLFIARPIVQWNLVILFHLLCLIFQSSVVIVNQIWLRNLQRAFWFMTFWSKLFSPTDIWPTLESMFMVQWKF